MLKKLKFSKRIRPSQLFEPGTDGRESKPNREDKLPAR